jgi:hypothetical protein
MLAPDPPTLAACPSYHLLPQPLRVEWCQSTRLFYLHSTSQHEQQLAKLNLHELLRVKTELQLVGGSNLDVRSVPAHKRADLPGEVDALIVAKYSLGEGCGPLKRV